MHQAAVTATGRALEKVAACRSRCGGRRRYVHGLPMYCLDVRQYRLAAQRLAREEDGARAREAAQQLVQAAQAVGHAGQQQRLLAKRGVEVQLRYKQYGASSTVCALHRTGSSGSSSIEWAWDHPMAACQGSAA